MALPPYSLALLAWVACIVLGLYLGKQKGRSAVEAFLISLVFGPFGVIVVGMLPTPRQLPKNPTEEQWKDLIDWTDVNRPEDEKKARQAAYARWLTLYGPKRRTVLTGNGRISVVCMCGQEAIVERAKEGKPIRCAACGLHFIVQPPAAATPPTAPTGP